MLSTGTDAEPGHRPARPTRSTALGLTAGTTNLTPAPLSGETLTIAATGGGSATSITFGTGAGQISTLNQLNTALAANNLQASISTTGADQHRDHQQRGLVDDRHDHRHGNGKRAAFSGLTAAAPVGDPNSQSTRASLVAQYNQVLAQINTTSQDSSFNGINLLNGDTLNLTFDETGASKLAIPGVTFNDAGLGLSTPDRGHRLPGQQLGQHSAGAAEPGQHHAAHGGIEPRFEPVDRARSVRTSTRT